MWCDVCSCFCVIFKHERRRSLVSTCGFKNLQDKRPGWSVHLKIVLCLFDSLHFYVFKDVSLKMLEMPGSHSHSYVFFLNSPRSLLSVRQQWQLRLAVLCSGYVPLMAHQYYVCPDVCVCVCGSAMWKRLTGRQTGMDSSKSNLLVLQSETRSC